MTVRRALLSLTTALVVVTACTAGPPPPALGPTQARCRADLAPSPFKKPDVTRILVADFSTGASVENDFAERFERRTADELRRLSGEAPADPARRGPEPAGAAIEIERLHCAIGDHEQAHVIAEARGADYVVWGRACEDAGEGHPSGAPGVCPRITIHRHYAQLRRAIEAGAEILSTVDMELPRVPPDDPLPVVHFVMGMHFRGRTERSHSGDDWRLAARFFRWSTDGVAADARHRELLDLLAGRAYLNLGDVTESRRICGRGHHRVKGAGTDLEAALVMCLAESLKVQGDGPGALDNFQSALGLAEKTHDDELAAGALNGIGTLLISKGDVAAGVEHLRRAAAMSIRAYGEDTQETGVIEATLADALEAQRDFKGALEHYRRGLASMEKSLGADSFLAGLMSFHVGRMLAQQGDLAGAIQLYERALRVFVAQGATAERQVVMVQTQLGSARQGHGEPTRALDHFQKALTLARTVYGPSHSEVAAIELLLGLAFFEQGDFPNAHEHDYRALVIVETLYGSDALELILPLRGIALAQRQQDDLDGAEAQLTRALAIARQKLGAEHATIGRLLVDLGALELRRGHLDGASSLCEPGLRILEAAMGHDQSDTQEGLVCVAAVEGRRNGWKSGVGAVVILRESKNGADPLLQPGDWVVAVDGKPIRSPAQLAEAKSAAPADRPVVLTVVRKRKRIQVPLSRHPVGVRLLF
jgi:tetratricopeptide (TPR) repeat protein